MSPSIPPEQGEGEREQVMGFVAELRGVARSLRRANFQAYGNLVDQVATEIREAAESRSLHAQRTRGRLRCG